MKDSVQRDLSLNFASPLPQKTVRSSIISKSQMPNNLTVSIAEKPKSQQVANQSSNAHYNLTQSRPVESDSVQAVCSYLPGQHHINDMSEQVNNTFENRAQHHLIGNRHQNRQQPDNMTNYAVAPHDDSPVSASHLDTYEYLGTPNKRARRF